VGLDGVSDVSDCAYFVEAHIQPSLPFLRTLYPPSLTAIALRLSTHRDFEVVVRTLRSQCQLCHTLTTVCQTNTRILCNACVRTLPLSSPFVLAKGVTLEYNARYARSLRYRDHFIQHLGLIVPSQLMTAYNVDPESEFLALCSRALVYNELPDPIEVAKFQTWLDSVHSTLHPHYPQDIQPSKFSDWATSSNCTATVIRDCKEAYSRLQETKPTQRLAKKYSVFKLFSKWEKAMKTSPVGPCLNNKPRAIQACGPAATVFTGTMFHPMQHYFHETWRGKFNICFAAGKSAEELSQWLDDHLEGKSSYWEDDFSLFDSTVSKDMQLVALRQYMKAKMHLNSPWGWAIRNAQIDASGFTRYGWKYSISGTVRSGVADTCLTNSILNAYVHLYGLHTLNPSFTFHELLSRVAMMIMGDDNLLMVEDCIKVVGLEDEIRKLGFLPKLHRVRTPEELVFLNMRPYPMDDGRHRFGPKVGRILARLGTSTTDQKLHSAYLHGCFKAFQASTSHIPVLNDLVARAINPSDGLLRHFDRGLEHSLEMRRYLSYQAMSKRAVPESKATVAFLLALYGITMAQLCSVRGAMRSIERFPAFMFHDVVAKICSVDC